MPALTSRETARTRLKDQFDAILERFIPSDPRVPLKGSIFADFENQVYENGFPLLNAMIEERIKLDTKASTVEPGRCPHCSSANTYLRHENQEVKIHSPTGTLQMYKQSARCRSCDRSFSPSVS
jgi:hypothetical protein